MKNSTLILFLVILFSVEIGFFELLRRSYTNETKYIYATMKQPVTLTWKEKNTFWYSVVLRDSLGRTERLGSMSKLANGIGWKYEINEVISEDINNIK